MSSIKNIFKYILSMPKTLYINFKVFDLHTAIHMPVICSHNVHIHEIHRNSILIEGTPKFGMVKLGISNGSYGAGCNGKSIISISKNGELIFTGVANICNYFTINIGTAGKVRIGSGFWSNYGMLISCSDRIIFGDDALLGWNSTFVDGDGHKVYSISDNNIQTNSKLPISIGKHVWFASNTITLKGGEVGDNSVVGQGCVITKPFPNKNVLLGGGAS